MKTNKWLVPWLFLGCLLISTELKAQITVDSTDFATVGDTIIIANDTVPPVGISVGGTGAQTWDFTSLQIDYFDTLRFRDIDNATDDSLFPGSNLVMETPYQTSYMDFSFSSLNDLGFFGDPMGVGIGFPLNFDPPQKRMEFPSTNGSSFIDTTEFVLTMLGSDLDPMLPSLGLDSIRINHSGYITSQIDAYGTLQFPSGTFNTIRQLYAEKTVDSIFAYCNNVSDCDLSPLPYVLPFGWSLIPGMLLSLSGLPPDNPVKDSTYTYRWLANNKDFPIVEMETETAGGNVTVVRFKIDTAVVAIITSVSDVLCKDSCDGTATATGISGVEPYSYLWDDPNSQTTATATGLCAGTYSVKVIDANGDTSTTSAITIINEPLALSGGTITTTPDSGSAQGTASVSGVSGGTLPYSYSWSPSGGNSAFASNLTAGPYTVTITDSNGCTFAISDTVDFVSACNITSSFTSSTTNICAGETINFTNTSTGATSYDWLENGVSFATTTNSTRTFGTAGLFTISLIADNGSCSDTSMIIITINPVPSIDTVTATDASSCGVNDGMIIITASGGTSPLQYSIDGGFTFFGSGSFTGLSPGNYDVAVTDVNGCLVLGGTLTISSPGSPTTSAGPNDAICDGTGYTLSGTMGWPADSITWTTSGTGTFDNDNLLLATYTPSPSDISNGSVTLTITTNDPDGGGPCLAATDFMILSISQPPTANAGADGNICEGETYMLPGASVSGASSLTWTTSGTGFFDNANVLTPTYTPSNSDITAGSVTLTITTNDPTGPCGAASNGMVLTINPTPSKPTIDQNGNILSCAVTASSYQWFFNGNQISGETNQFHTATASGFYMVEITDNNGCVSTSDPLNFTLIGTRELIALSRINIYPNPNEGTFTIEIQVKETQDIRLRITNVIGQEIFIDELKQFSGIYRKEVDLKENSTGVYQLHVITNKGEATRKIVKE